MSLRYELVIRANTVEEIMKDLSDYMGFDMSDRTGDIEELEDGLGCDITNYVEIIAYEED